MEADPATSLSSQNRSAENVQQYRNRYGMRNQQMQLLVCNHAIGLWLFPSMKSLAFFHLFQPARSGLVLRRRDETRHSTSSSRSIRILFLDFISSAEIVFILST